jgi:hypothetical protein
MEDGFFEAITGQSRYFTNLTSKSLLSTLSPILTQISLTVPAPGEATAANIFMVSRVAMTRNGLSSHLRLFRGFAAAREGLGDEEAVLVAENAGEIAFELNEHLHVLRETAFFRLGHLG